MNEPKIDGLARHLGAQDRRRSLQALAVGLAAAAATPLVARGKKKKSRNKCKKQVASCRNAFDELCDGSENPAGCQAAVAECCAPLKSCKAGEAMRCVIDLFLASA